MGRGWAGSETLGPPARLPRWEGILAPGLRFSATSWPVGGFARGEGGGAPCHSRGLAWLQSLQAEGDVVEGGTFEASTLTPPVTTLGLFRPGPDPALWQSKAWHGFSGFGLSDPELEFPVCPRVDYRCGVWDRPSGRLPFSCPHSAYFLYLDTDTPCCIPPVGWQGGKVAGRGLQGPPPWVVVGEQCILLCRPLWPHPSRSFRRLAVAF